MVKKLLSILLVLILLGLTIFFWYRYKRLIGRYSDLIANPTTEYITDTVYIDKPFEPEPTFSQFVKPKRILVYDTIINVVHKVKDSISYSISSQDSLFQFILEKDKIKLNLFNQTSGIYSSRIFPINLEDYQYNWYQGNLTSEYVGKKLKIKPYAYAKCRVFHHLMDMGAGISFKTKKFDYNLGINVYHYPSYMKGIGTDLEISIKYNF